MSTVDSASVVGFDYAGMYRTIGSWPLEGSDTPDLQGQSTPWPSNRREITIHLSGLSLASPWFQKTLTRLMELLNLGSNWNGYGEKPVHEASAKRLLRILDSAGYSGRPMTVVPLPDGGLQMEWHCPSASLEIEVPPVGEALGWFCRHKDDLDDEWTVNSGAGLTLLADRLREFA